MTESPLLRTVGVSRSFGGVTAVDGVDLEVGRGEVHAVVGPNGAGKTTLFNLISGVVKPDAGSILLNQNDISSLPTHRRVPLGVVRTFQNIRLFGGLTVRENIVVAQHARARLGGMSAGVLRRREMERCLRQEVEDGLALLNLEKYSDLLASGLPYGVQKRVELARAMASRPTVVLLDEPTAGMNEVESRQLMDEITRMKDTGTTIVLVEHDMEVVMGASDSVTVLNFGQVIACGAPGDVVSNPAVQEAYLGS